MKRLVFPVLLTAGLLTTGCAETGPSDVLGAVQLMCPEFGESSRCNAFAMMSGRDGQDVSGLATWSTSDPAIATINTTGLVTALRSGEVAIRVSYQDAAAFQVVWVVPGQGIYGTSRTLAGRVLSMVGPLPGVLMEILNGPNAGRSMTTSSDGRFYMDNLQDGPFTIRLSKAGYRTAEYQWSIPGGAERIPTLTASQQDR